MKHLCLAIMVIAVFLAGCSSGGGNPVAPEKSSEVLGNIPVINLSDVGGVKEATGLFGAYELTINPDEVTAELVTKRFGTIGDSYIVSGVSFFTMTPCADCLKIAGVSLDLDGNIWLKYEVSHPFDKGDTLLPPSAINRLDLDVFDLALVVHPPGIYPVSVKRI